MSETPTRSDHLAEVAGFLSTAEHHRRKEMAAMWLLGDHASRLLYDHRLSHNLIVTKTGVGMSELCRALTIRATYSSLNQIP